MSDRLTDTYLDDAVEKMRECLRDLRRITDPEARAVRERCMDRMTATARTFNELRESNEALEREVEHLQGQIKKFEKEALLLAHITEMAADVERRMFTGKEFLAFIRKHTSPWFDWEWKTT